MATTNDPLLLGKTRNWPKLHGLGVDAWNTWARSVVDQGIDDEWVIKFTNNFGPNSFEGFEFPRGTSFEHEGVQRSVSFENSTFHGNIKFKRYGSLRYNSFKGATFKGDSSFENIPFSFGNFEEAVFEKKVIFWGAKFEHLAQFKGAYFYGVADFRRATFIHPADFSDTTFAEDAIFELSVFQSKPIFTNASFQTTIPNFRASHFASQFPPDFHNSNFSYPIDKNEKNKILNLRNRVLGICSLDDGSERLRILKKLAAESVNHDEELKFFAMEMRAKRKHEIQYGKITNWPKLIINHAYDLFSDFGQSVVRPLTCLAIVLLVSAYCFAALIRDTPLARLKAIVEWESGVLTASLTSLLPFAGQTAIGRKVVEEALCAGSKDNDITHIACLSDIYRISAVEGVTAFIFIFLLGLALRNIAKIR